MDTETTHQRTRSSNGLPVLLEGEYHLYVSCSEDECQYAQELVDDLRKENDVVVFFSADEIRPGSFIPTIVSEKLESCLMVVLLISREYLDDPRYNCEIYRALTKAYTSRSNADCLILVLKEDVVLPPAFKGRQYIEAFDGEPVKQTIVNTLVGSDFAGEVVPNCVERKTRELEELRAQGADPSIALLRILLAKSKRYFEDNLDSSTFIQTAAYDASLDNLNKNNVLILTGHPGEGKTTLATKLLLDTTPVDRILKLNCPSDWKLVDPSSNLFDAIMIDDIFGAGGLDDTLFREWERELQDVDRITQPQKKNKENARNSSEKRQETRKSAEAIKKKKKNTGANTSKSTNDVGDIKPTKVIITTRHYILEELKQRLVKQKLFREENIQMLLSSKLTDKEISLMLDVHLKKKKRSCSELDIQSCLRSIRGPNMVLPTDSPIPFGFPECVSLYSKNDDIFRKGPEFFANPNAFFKTCVEELFQDEDRFFGLLIIWANRNQKVTVAELELSSISEHVKDVAVSFGFIRYEVEAVKKAKKSLKYHEGSFLTYTSYNGSYEFRHSVISDMIGIVISREYPEAALRYAPRDFLMKYVIIGDAVPNNYQFRVEPRQYEKLSDAMIRVIGGNPAQKGFTSRIGAHLGESQRWFRQESQYKPNMGCDFSIVFHEAFNDSEFVDRFLTHIQNEGKIRELFSGHVLQFDGVFKGYGVKFEQLPFHLLSYLVLSNKYTIAKEIIQRKILVNDDTRKLEKSEMDISLLLAVDKEDDEMVKFLLKYGAPVSGDALYVAAHKSNIRLLDILVPNPGTDINDKGHIIGGNTVLIMAAKRGKVNVARYLVEKGADVGVRNGKNMSALDKAVLHDHEEICKILIKYGANLNIKAGKFKRTPLHVAADMGFTKIAEILLAKGAKLDIKDHKGHCPIHCAAIRKHNDIALAILSHDKSKANLKAKSYGTKSFMKGLTPYHIAIWKDNDELLRTLIKLGVDPNVGNWFGETPLYYAISKGKEQQAKQLIAVSDVNKQQKQGFSPLHLAIYRKMDEVTKRLSHQADVNIRDKFGKTPLHVACERGNLKAVELLVNTRADLRMITKRGDTVYHILIRGMYKLKGKRMSHDHLGEIVKLLRQKDPDFAARELTNKKGHACSADAFQERGLQPSDILNDLSDVSDSSDVEDISFEISDSEESDESYYDSDWDQ